MVMSGGFAVFLFGGGGRGLGGGDQSRTETSRVHQTVMDYSTI